MLLSLSSHELQLLKLFNELEELQEFRAGKKKAHL